MNTIRFIIVAIAGINIGIIIGRLIWDKNLNSNERKSVRKHEQKEEFCCVCGCEVVDVETFCEECSSKKHSAK